MPRPNEAPSRFGRRVAVTLACALVAALGSVVVDALPAHAATVWYAYPDGGASSPSSCPQTSVAASQCTLAQAIGLAVSGDTVQLAAGTYDDHGLTLGEPISILGAPTSPGTVVIDGQDAGPILSIAAGVSPGVSGVTLTNGQNGGFGGAITGSVSGSGLNLSDSILSDDHAGSGGAVAVTSTTGRVVLTDDTFEDDTAINDGGAVYQNAPNDSFTGNTFIGNSANEGGALYANETVQVMDDTFTQNSAEFGGAVFEEEGGASLVSDTIDGNTTTNTTPPSGAVDWGTVAVTGVGSAGTIIADNAGGNCGPNGVSLGVADNGYNIDSGTSCGFYNSTSLSNTEPLVGGLASNGGPTQTMALMPGSPAAGLIPNGTPGLCPATDQRGFSSPSGAACDVGAVQFVVYAAPGRSFSTTENTPLSEPAGTLAAGVADTNPGASSWTATETSPPGNGSVSVNADGSFIYTPNSGYLGTDSFGYTLTDNGGNVSVPAMVNLNVGPPVFSIDVDGGSSASIAAGTSATLAQSGLPPSGVGSVVFSSPTDPDLCTLSLPSTSCSTSTDLAPGTYGPVTATFAGNTTATNTVSLTVAASPEISVQFTGSLVYANRGPLTSGTITVSPGTGPITSVEGSGTMAGLDGGSATIEVGIVRVGTFYLGDITVKDHDADLDTTSIVAALTITRTPAGLAAGTAYGLNLHGLYDLSFVL